MRLSYEISYYETVYQMCSQTNYEMSYETNYEIILLIKRRLAKEINNFTQNIMTTNDNRFFLRLIAFA